MRDLHSFPRETIRAVFTDLDDTLTSDGMLASQTLASLEALHRQGLKVCIVSGRPAGWADCLMRLFPLDAMVFENGAGTMIRRGEKIKTVNTGKSPSKLLPLFRRLKRSIPKLKLATDQPYRLFDLAIDFNEEPPRLSESQVDALLEKLSHEKGLTHKLSSIHVNVWVGKHTKQTACRKLIRTLQLEPSQIAFCGDSPNDEPLFHFFENSVGVANVKRHLSRMQHHPHYVTQGEGGKGFSEFAEFLLSSGKKIS